MKKLLYIIPVLLLLAGCGEQEFDATVSNTLGAEGYNVSSIKNINRVVYNNVDSTFVIEITLNKQEAVDAIWIDMYDPDNNKMNEEPFYLFDDGNPEHSDGAAHDLTFANKYAMSSTFANGSYLIEYYATERYMNTTRKLGVQSFEFDNGQTNIAPVVSNLNAPDTALVNDPEQVLVVSFSLKASDENGSNDIESVYMDLFNRDETTVLSRLELKDDGNNTAGGSGDEVAGDGIYTLTLQVDSGNQTASYRMEFAARDRGKKVSNIITHYFEIIIDL